MRKKYRFGKSSTQRLATCHPDLQKILLAAIDVSPVDFGIAEGHRSLEKQLSYYNSGKSKIDGYKRKGKHNFSPSLAADVYPYVNGKAAWNVETLSFVVGVISGVANALLDAGEIEYAIRWGGNWDRDGEILFDQSFDDAPHIELVNP